MAISDITESTPYDLTSFQDTTQFSITDIAYDVTIDDIPFLLRASNQNPYRRETAQYRKDQFDSSPEPGEQSLSGWWLRSQTSWHNGSGITFYDPGTDYQHVSHRFNDSRGVDVWTIGQATLLPEVFHAYTGAAGINSAVGNDGTNDCLVNGDVNGVLKKITLNGDATANSANIIAYSTSYPDGHSGSNYPFLSVTTDGSYYYAMCPRCVHSGPISTATAPGSAGAGDRIEYKYSTTDVSVGFIKYVKGYLLLGNGKTLTNLYNSSSTLTSSSTHTTGSVDIPTTSGSNVYEKIHLNGSWNWIDATGGPNFIYVAGRAGSRSEVWAVGFDDTANTLDMAGATVAIEMPDGELINTIQYYLGYLAIGTNLGVRICPVSSTGAVTLGPLLFEQAYDVHDIAARDSYVYAATKVNQDSSAYTNSCLIRIDLSQQFDDGTFAYAYDLEYRSGETVSYNVMTKALTSNVATLTLTKPHQYKVGETVVVSGVDATFNGTFTVTAVTSNTVSYAKTASDVTAVDISPYGSIVDTAESSDCTEVHFLDDRLVMIINEGSTSGELQVQHSTLKRPSGWLKTGTIRFATVEPKYFRYINTKCSTGVGDTIGITMIDQNGSEYPLVEVSGGLTNQDIFITNPTTAQTDVSIKFTFNNSSEDNSLPILESYQLKATPAVHRQRLIQYPLSCFNREMDRFSTEYGYDGRAIELVNRLEALEETSKFVTIRDFNTDEEFVGLIDEVRFTSESSPDKNYNNFGGTLLVTVRKM